MADIDDLFVPPNADAYETDEHRRGPPLSYVAEKARAALEQIHGLCRDLKPRSRDGQDTVESLAARANTAFYFALVSFLALYNSMGRLGEWERQEEKIKALRELPGSAFEEWLDSVESEGSVTG